MPDASAAPAPFTALRSPARIGRALVAARRQAGLSQAETAAAAGISREALSRLENGHRNAGAQTLNAVLDVLGYEMAFLPRSQRAQQLRDWARTAHGG